MRYHFGFWNLVEPGALIVEDHEFAILWRAAISAIKSLRNLKRLPTFAPRRRVRLIITSRKSEPPRSRPSSRTIIIWRTVLAVNASGNLDKNNADKRSNGGHGYLENQKRK